MKNVWTVRGIVFSALFAALVSALSWVKIQPGFSPVPITLESLVVMLAGAFLGATYGFFSMSLVVLLLALGLPLLAGSGGLALLLGPTGGYVWMYPIDALLIGWFVTRIRGNGLLAGVKIFLVVEVFGSLLCYVTGVPWLAHFLHIPLQKAMWLGFYPYLPGDLIKALVTTLIVLPIRRVYPATRLVGRGGSSNVAVLSDS